MNFQMLHTFVIDAGVNYELILNITKLKVFFMYINDYSLIQGDFDPKPLPPTPIDDPTNMVYSDLDLIDVLALLKIPADVAGRFYHQMRKLWFNEGIVEPRFHIVRMIEGNGQIVGVFYENEWQIYKIFLSNTILKLQPKGKLFYLTHEIVHYIDYHLHNRVTLTEHETDIKAKDMLQAWGLM